MFLLKNLQQQDVPLWNKEIYRIRKTATDNWRGYTEDNVTTPITVEEIINSSNTKEMIALMLKVYWIDIMETIRTLTGATLHW